MDDIESLISSGHLTHNTNVNFILGTYKSLLKSFETHFIKLIDAKPRKFHFSLSGNVEAPHVFYKLKYLRIHFSEDMDYWFDAINVKIGIHRSSI